MRIYARSPKRRQLREVDWGNPDIHVSLRGDVRLQLDDFTVKLDSHEVSDLITYYQRAKASAA